MRNAISRGLPLLLAALILFSFYGCSGKETTAYGVFIGLSPEHTERLANYTMVVIDAEYYTKEEISQLKKNGVTIYSYLNIGSVETFREVFHSLQACRLGAYEDWPEEYWIDVACADWQAYITAAADALVSKGIDGFFLDNADVYYYYPDPEIFDGLVTIIQSIQIHQKPILLNGADTFVTEAVLEPETPLISIAGINQECVFTDIDFQQNLLIHQDADTTSYYHDYLMRCASAGLSVYLTEYAALDSEAIEDTLKKYCSKNGFHYYVSPSITLD